MNARICKSNKDKGGRVKETRTGKGYRGMQGGERKEASTGLRGTVRSGVALQVSWEITLCSIRRATSSPACASILRSRRHQLLVALFPRHVLSTPFQPGSQPSGPVM